jgi:myosin heavy subunit
MNEYISKANESIEKGSITYEKGEPHAFDMSMNAIFQILNKDDRKKENQALVISGESGAGKTECAKLCMKFIAYYFGSKNENPEGEKEVSL